MKGRTILQATLLSVLVSCFYNPNLRDCTVACGANQSCPSSLRCVDGMCSHGASCPPRDAATPPPDASAPPPDASAPPPEAGIEAPADDATEAGTDGSCMRPDVLPEALPSAVPNLVLWLDTENDPSTSPTFRWRDRSGLLNHATATGTQSPTLVPSRDCRPPTVEFSGDGQYLSLPGGMTAFTSGISIFVVVEPRPSLTPFGVDGVHMIDFSSDYGTLSNAIVFGRGGSDGSAIYYSTSLAAMPTEGVVVDYELQLLEELSSGGPVTQTPNGDFYKNGVHVGAGGSHGILPTFRNSNLIGRSNIADHPNNPDFHGAMGEIIIYNRILREVERQLVERYLLGRWNIRPSARATSTASWALRYATPIPTRP